MYLEFVDTSEAARRLALSEPYLEELRMADNGPQFHHIGRAVRYRVDDLDAWMKARAVEGQPHV